MINKYSISPMVPATLLSLLLVGCGGDDNKGFLDPAPEVSSLTAYPQAFVLKQGETQHVDLTQSVVANKVSSWELTELDDNTGLGVAVRGDKTSFDYQALTAGAGAFNYTVKGDNLTATSQIVLAVNAGETPGNNIPVANNVALSTFNNADATVDLSGHITDADGDTLRINKLVSASNRFTLNGFQVTFAPDGFVGVDQAVYSVDDGRGGYALAYIVVTSKDANPPVSNTAPVAKDDSLSMDVAKQSMLNINLGALMSDVDGDSLKVTTLYSSNGRAVIKGNASVDYTPGHFRGVDQFTYLVSDGKGGYDLGTVTVTVGDSTPPTPPTPALVAYQQAFVLDVDQLQTIDVTQSVTSEHLDAWSLTTVQDSTNLGVVSAKTATTFNYLAQTPGVAQIDYSVQGGSLSASSTITVAINAPVTPDNHRPEAEDAQLTTLNNVSKTIDLQGKISDVDGDTLTITLHANPRFSLNGTQLSFTPNGFIGLDQAVYSVEDGKGGYALANIVAISEDANPPIPNMAPTAKGKNFTLDVATNATLSIDLVTQQLIADADGDALSIAHIYTANNRATKQGTTGITYTPGAFRGVDQFTYVITDGKDGYAMNAITVVVNDSTPANKIPTAGPVTAKMLHNDPAITISVSGAVNDADGNALNIVSISGALGQASLNPTNALSMRYEPKGFVGTDRFVYVVSDDNGGYAMGEVTVTVTDSNPTAPVANTVQENTLLDTPINIDLSAYISDKETETANLVISQVTAATSPAIATLSGQTVTYTPNGFIGNDILTYTVTDGRHSTNGTIVISVNERGAHSIIARDVHLSTAVNTPISIDLSDKIQSADPTAGELTVISVAGTALGDVTILNNTITYKPKPDVYGNGAFVYTVKDSHTPAHYAQGNVTVEITSPPAPEITQLEVKQEAAGFLSADVTCALCDITKYQYAWIINGLTVGTGEAYTPTAADDGFNIRLEVTGRDVYGQVAPMQYVVYTKNKVIKIFRSNGAFAALKTDESVVVWGHKDKGGDTSSVYQQLAPGSDIQTIYSSSGSFAALRRNGSVITWGDRVNDNFDAAKLSSGVESIYSSALSFAAIKNGGEVVTWGRSDFGGDSSAVQDHLLSGVKMIYGAHDTFTAIKDDNTVVIWGNIKSAGTGQSNSTPAPNILPDNWISITTTLGGYAALMDDGSVITWGYNRNGGDSRAVRSQLSSGVKAIYANENAFAAVKDDNSVVSWGYAGSGGSGSSVPLVNVKTISASGDGFAAVTFDGTVVGWGNSYPPSGLTNVKEIITNPRAFAAIKDDGSVVTWGDADYGGKANQSILNSLRGVHTIIGSGWAFAGIKDDKIIYWGNLGDNQTLNLTIKDISTTYGAFATINYDDTVTTFGSSKNGSGADSSKVKAELSPSLVLMESSIN